jgi:hypothetical protein
VSLAAVAGGAAAAEAGAGAGAGAGAAEAAGRAPRAGELERPKNWHKWVKAAYFRTITDTQKEAAEAAGISVRSLRDYENHPDLGALARQEARLLFHSDLLDQAMKAVLLSTKRGNADLGFRVLERLDPAFAPPVQRIAARTQNEHAIAAAVIELPAESEGLESEEPEDVLERLGRDLAAAAQQAALPALPAEASGRGADADVGADDHPSRPARERSSKVKAVLERLERKKQKPAARVRTANVLRRRSQDDDDFGDEDYEL